MATAKLNAFTPNQLGEIMTQIFASQNFWTVNSHIPVDERAGVLNNVLYRGQWPDKPIFSPYAKTHDGYSQGKNTHLDHSVLALV